MRPTARSTMRMLLAGALAALSCACTSWTAVRRDATWTLFVKDGEPVDIERFDRALTPAFEVVEHRMGPFARPVRVHAFDSESGERPVESPPLAAEQFGERAYVPGIGPTRVRAFHVRGTSPFQASGVFLGVAEVGTAVHELVHARIAEGGFDLPLWFEEGLASYWGDGAFYHGHWVVDGLSCWPLRELADQRLEDDELRRLLTLHAHDEYDARENLLAHFLGWALVFDLATESPDAGWLEWQRTFDAESRRDGLVAAARRRLERTLADETRTRWFERLRSGHPCTRAATAKGLWKLRDVRAIDALLDALEREDEPELRVLMALNVLLATGEMRLGRARWERLSLVVFPVLRDTELEDEREQEALRDVYDSMRRWQSRSRRGSRSALAELARFWEE